MDKKSSVIEVTGIVKECFPNAQFKVTLDTGQEVVAHLSGKIRKNYIKVLIGDKVKIELSPYDLTRGRIIYRIK